MKSTSKTSARVLLRYPCPALFVYFYIAFDGSSRVSEWTSKLTSYRQTSKDIDIQKTSSQQ